MLVEERKAQFDQVVCPQGGMMASTVADKESPLGRALCKYKDAAKLDASNATYKLHVGRLLLVQNKVDEALQYLQASMARKPTSMEVR